MIIEIKNYTGVADCKSQLLNSRESYKFSTKIHSGKIYCFIGEINSGNWGLVSGIGGMGRKPVKKTISNLDGQIFIDNIEIDSQKLKNISCFVGEKSSNKTIRKTIESYLTKNKEFSYTELQKAFNLTDDRIERKFEHISFKKWNASIAIGVASQKKIFCYPYITDENKHLLIVKKTLDFLIKNDKFILIPINERMIEYFDKNEIIYEKIFYKTSQEESQISFDD